MPSSPAPLYKGDTVDLVAVWLVLWRYKYLIILIAAISTGVAVLLALTATPIYRAEVVVIPTRESGVSDASSLASRLGGLAGLAGINLGSTGGAGLDALAVLRSRNLVEQFVSRKGLVAELTSDTQSASSLWFAVDRFRSTIVSVVPDNDRGTTTIAIRWRDPSVAANWANEFVALANDIVRTRARDDAGRNIDYLNKQLEETNVVELRRVLYSLIETETQKMMLANARVEYAFTIVDPAVAPETRVSPRRTLMVLAGGVLGVFLGVVVALLANAVRSYRAQSAAAGAVSTR
jgi:uncharacterized protein involved in exopolysaccharide biosynthesis